MKYLFGQQPQKLSILITVLFFLIGAIFTWFTIETSSIIYKIIAMVIVGDIFAGSFSNLTYSTNLFYFNQLKKTKLFAPPVFTAVHLVHLIILGLVVNELSLVLLFDFIVLLVLSFVKLEKRFHSLLIMLSVLPGLIGFDIYGLFLAISVAMLGIKTIAGYKLGMIRIKNRLEVVK